MVWTQRGRHAIIPAHWKELPSSSARATRTRMLLDGAIEIEVSDGNRRTLRGGDVLLMEDTAGRGHRTRHVEPRERRSLFIVLDDQPKTA